MRVVRGARNTLEAMQILDEVVRNSVIKIMVAIKAREDVEPMSGVSNIVTHSLPL
ncbi:MULTISPECIES: hypothetical protein [Bradyrhizobium]|uniref:hypothetical protein n=1 Tax=Bradyrhizobium TaxID=374 RepID=UPI00132F9301|nr:MULTISPECIES: hypothetical protein [Bradyrhizobium]MCA6105403.1 hypothetical protein [Bradyrhizobium australafricanum]